MRTAHCYTMPVHDIGETWFDKLKRFLRLGNPEPKEGRKRVNPFNPYGHWAAGWYPMTTPERRGENGMDGRPRG